MICVVQLIVYHQTTAFTFNTRTEQFQSVNKDGRSLCDVTHRFLMSGCSTVAMTAPDPAYLPAHPKMGKEVEPVWSRDCGPSRYNNCGKHMLLLASLAQLGVLLEG